MERQLSDEVWELVMRMPRKLREVLTLHARHGLSTKEIADVLQLPEGTVKSRLSRARHKMTRMWKEKAGYEEK